MAGKKDGAKTTRKQRLPQSAQVALLVSVLVIIAGRSACNNPWERVTSFASPVAKPKDDSLTVAEYAARGFPAPDHPWPLADYQKAAQSLKELADRDATQLPRSGSPKSGAVFARLVAIDNLPTAPASPGDDVDQLLPWLNPALQVFTTYSMGRGKNFDEESLRITAFVLRLNTRLLTSMDRASSAEPAATQASQRAWLTTARGGAAKLFTGALTMLGAEDLSSPPDAALDLADVLAETLPQVFGSFTDEQQSALLTKIRAIHARSSDIPLSSRLRKLEGALKSP